MTLSIIQERPKNKLISAYWQPELQFSMSLKFLRGAKPDLKKATGNNNNRGHLLGSPRIHIINLRSFLTIKLKPQIES